jgi:hypothetical protein
MSVASDISVHILSLDKIQEDIPAEFKPSEHEIPIICQDMFIAQDFTMAHQKRVRNID